MTTKTKADTRELIHSLLTEEYIAMRGEILQRVNMQRQLEQMVFLISAAIVGSAIFTSGSGIVLLLITSLALFSLSIHFFSEDIGIANAAAYLHGVVRSRIIENASSDPDERARIERFVLGWEGFRRDQFLATGSNYVLTVNRTLISLLPGASCVAAFFYFRAGSSFRDFFSTVSFVEAGLLLVNALVLLALLFLGYQMPSIYRSISEGSRS